MKKYIKIDKNIIEDILSDITTIKFYAIMENINKQHDTFFHDICLVEDKILKIAGDEF